MASRPTVADEIEHEGELLAERGKRKGRVRADAEDRHTGVVERLDVLLQFDHRPVRIPHGPFPARNDVLPTNRNHPDIVLLS